MDSHFLVDAGCICDGTPATASVIRDMILECSVQGVTS